MATAFYVVEASDWDADAGPTGYERAHVWYGPLVTREEADELSDGSMEDDAIVVEMDRGDDAPEAPAEEPGFAVAMAERAHEVAVQALTELWGRVTPDVRGAVDAECGGLVSALDKLRDAARALDALDGA